MGITEMLDELKSKACRDEKLRAELLETSTASQRILSKMQRTGI